MSRLTRRELLGGALGTSAALMLAACAPTTTTSAPTQAAATAAATTGPKKPTGTLTVANVTLGNPGYTPARQSTAEQITAFATFTETLIERKPDRTLGPRLAKQWTISPDGLTYTFDLRTDVKWHDGTPFTSEDVKYSIEQAGREGSIAVRAAQIKSLVAGVDTPTPDRAVVRLKKADISFIATLAGPGTNAAGMFSKKYVDSVGEDVAAAKPLGTGPWKFAEFKPGELIRVTAVEGHWRKTPAFAEMVIRQVPEDATRLAMLLRGEADIAQLALSNLKQVDGAGLPTFKQPNAYAIFISLQGQYLPTRPTFKKDVPWAADPADKTAWERARKVREAMNVAIDRKTIISTVLAGQGVGATYPYAVPGSEFDDASYKQYAYDPTRAKALLAEAGHPNGFDFPLLLVEASGAPLAPETGQAVAQYWQAVGLRPKLSNADYTATVRGQIINRSIPGTAFTFRFVTYDEPVIGHTGNFHSKADTLLGVEYAAVDELVDKALGTPDTKARKELEIQLGKLVLDEHFLVPIAWVNSLQVGSKKMKALPQVSGVSIMHNFEYAEPA